MSSYSSIVTSCRSFLREKLLSRKFLQEPLVQFFFLGALIYLLFGLFSQPNNSVQNNTLVVEADEIEWLQTTWQKRMNRMPTEEELDGLIEQYIRETIIYREALAMELDKDDPIIRRQLVQKFEFMIQELAVTTPPKEEELKKYFAENRDFYKAPSTYTFTQVFFDPDKRGRKTLEDAQAVKAKLIKQPDAVDTAGEFGDPFLLQNYYPEYAQIDIQKQFGTGFAESLVKLSPQQWHGPVLSGYGTHLVYIHSITEALAPQFAQVRDRVKQDLEDERRKSMKEETYNKLRDRYTIKIKKENGEIIIIQKEAK